MLLLLERQGCRDFHGCTFLVAAITLSCERSATRRRELTPIRIHFARMALRGRIASLQEIARYLNRSASSLSELLTRHEQ